MKHGLNKNYSEDTMLINGTICKEGYFSFNDSGKCIAIADGVGGNPGGKEASEFVLEMLNKLSTDNLEDCAYKINEELILYAEGISGKERMATTLTALFFNDDKPSIFIHVGNTRLYAVQGEYLKQLTKDHTTVEYLKSRGDYEAAEIAPRNEITACFGSGDLSAIKQITVHELDRAYSGFVMTSDGIHEYLSEEFLENFISADTYTEQAFIELSHEASKNGSLDDKSIIIVKI